MHPTRRVLVLSLLVFLTCIWSSTGTAEAKGGRPLTSYVAVMGPGLEHPWVEEAIGTAPKGYRGAGAELFLNLATRLGVTGEGAAAKLMSPPDRSQLGPRFDAWFFMSCTPNFSGCKKAIHEDLYPFAEPEGPVAYLSPGQERLFVQMFG